jgi:hypothetical protein
MKSRNSNSTTIGTRYSRIACKYRISVACFLAEFIKKCAVCLHSFFLSFAYSSFTFSVVQIIPKGPLVPHDTTALFQWSCRPTCRFLALSEAAAALRAANNAVSLADKSSPSLASLSTSSVHREGRGSRSDRAANGTTGATARWAVHDDTRKGETRCRVRQMALAGTSRTRGVFQVLKRFDSYVAYLERTRVFNFFFCVLHFLNKK